MSTGRKVDFLIAGVQKGGTTALHDYLRALPGVGFARMKEAHFFDDETLDWAAPNYSAYHALFPKGATLLGEATPIYCYWPDSLERIRAYNPAMKLVLLFRDPVARAFSHWKMEYARGLEREPFAWCIRDGRERVATGDPAAPGHHRVFSYVERGFYGTQLQRILGLFPHEQVLALRSEDLRDRPERVVPAVCDFLGLARPEGAPARRAVHAAADIPYPSRLDPDDVTHLRSQYATEMDRFSEMTGWKPSGF